MDFLICKSKDGHPQNDVIRTYDIESFHKTDDLCSIEFTMRNGNEYTWDFGVEEDEETSMKACDAEFKKICLAINK